MYIHVHVCTHIQYVHTFSMYTHVLYVCGLLYILLLSITIIMGTKNFLFTFRVLFLRFDLSIMHNYITLAVTKFCTIILIKLCKENYTLN